MKQFESTWQERRMSRLEDMGSLFRGVTVHEIEGEERARLRIYAQEQLDRARVNGDEASVEAWSHLIQTWCSGWRRQ
jgi:hypothetical protein